MSTKVEQASTNVQATTTATSSAPSSGTKISMFANKSGFVIPKNKLSGSLVPIFRGNKTLGSCDAPNEESIRQAQRKTKWGADLTQDISVRKGRAIAYQTRIDQITQQLKLGILEIGNNQDSPWTSQILNCDSAGDLIKNEMSELLELEKCKTIGEILKLNPSYEAPADYKPLLKEAKVPIPIKEYPDYNFIGLIYGPANDTQKRLEKETGAKVQVYGIKGDTREKAEILPAEGHIIHGIYDELYVNVSADTYEKVDAAVALVELLVTPVSVNLATASTTSTVVSGDDANVVNLSQGTTTRYTVSSSGVNQGVVQTLVGSAPAPAEGQYQAHAGLWFPTGPLPNPLLPPSGFITPGNPSPPLLNNAVQLSLSPMNLSNMPSLFGPHPVLAAGFGSVSQSPSLVPQGQRPQVLQHPYMARSPLLGYTGPSRNPNMPVFDSTPVQPNSSAPLPFSSNLRTPTGPPQIAASVMPSLPQSIQAATFLNRPHTLAGSSIGWSQASAATPASLGSSNKAQGPPLMVPLGHQPVSSQPIIVSETQLLTTSVGMASPVSQPSAPWLSGATANHPTAVPAFTSVPQPQVGLVISSLPKPGPAPIPIPMQSSPIAPVQPATVQALVPNLSPNPVLRPTPTPPMISNLAPPPLQSEIPGSVTKSGLSFTPIIKSPLTTSRPPQPGPGDFTFQPHRPQNLSLQVVPRPSGHPAPKKMLPLNQTLLPPRPPPTPSFQLEAYNSGPPPVMQSFSTPPTANQVNQSHSQMSGTLTGNWTTSPASQRYPAFQNRRPSAAAGPSQIGTRNANPASQMINSIGTYPPRPGNPVQFTQSSLATSSLPQSFLSPNQPLGSSLSFESSKQSSSPSGVQQIYDPFSPTSVSLNPRPAGHPGKGRKPENDPEYDDLMASVGVK